MSHVFISYSREDRPAVQRVAEALQAEGIPVWWDRAIKAGENFDEVLERRLREAAVVVVLWSKRSAQSKWVRAEATLGQRISSLVPAMIEDCERPLIFELIQTADLRRWTGDRQDPNWREFIADIRAHAAGRDKAKAAPVKPAEARTGMKTAAARPAAAAPAAKPAEGDVTIETTFWTSVKDSADAADFEAYLERYPSGHFAALARNRLAGLKERPPTEQPEAVKVEPKPAPASPPPPKRSEPAPPPKARAGGGRSVLFGGLGLVAAVAIAAAAFVVLGRPPGETTAQGGAPAVTDNAPIAAEGAGGADAVALREALDEATAEDPPDATAGTPPTDEPTVDLASAEGEVADPLPATTPADSVPEASPETLKSFRDCETCPLMIALPAGTFQMGSPDGEPGRYAYEGPQREVSVPAFAIGVYEVTFDQWQACLSDGACRGHEPGDEGWGKGARPAINLSWRDGQEYVRWLSKKTGKAYRLPTEAEWEYAARGGNAEAYWWGSQFRSSEVPSRQTEPVGTFRANAFGLHDVLGNAREWVEDCYQSILTLVPQDGSAARDGDCSKRVVRGGSFKSSPQDMRVANRGRLSPDLRDEYLGLRVVRDLGQ